MPQAQYNRERLKLLKLTEKRNSATGPHDPEQKPGQGVWQAICRARPLSHTLDTPQVVSVSVASNMCVFGGWPKCWLARDL
jgi:hypothetical protein